jgi:nucleoside-diphosphate-sugar epimerase
VKALVVGASGISGWNLASHLLERGWTVHGVSRRPAEGLDGMAPILVDVTDREATVHRAHTMIGWALGNAMNMGTTLAVYGTLCRELGHPFVFPGSPIQHAGVTDVSDAALVAEQLEWSATTPAAANQALNIVNGDVFRRRRLWDVLAADLGVEPGPYPGEARPLEHEMRGLEDTWRGIVSRHGLRETELGRLASWWHTDSDLGRPVETFADMTKSRSLGFHGFRDTEKTFLSLFDRLRSERVIP